MSRLIDGDRLLEWLNDLDTRGRIITMPDIRFIVSELANGSWISVRDRLPEKQEPVLVYVPPYSDEDEDEEYTGYVAMSYYTHTAKGGYWAGTDGNVYGAIGIIHEPSHWMPRPDPPNDVRSDYDGLLETGADQAGD